MGRGGWMKTVAVLLAVVTASCGGTGGGSSGSGQTFVFQARGRLNLIAQVVTNDPTVLKIIATLLDPQGNPFRNQRVTFEAEFPDATIVPANTPQNAPLACLPPPSHGNATRCTNRGAAITDDFGQAQVTLIAGLTLGRMRLTAEAPVNLDISSAISVTITNQGFIGGTALAILPTSATFVNPQVSANATSVTFTAVGGTPPFKWENVNDALGEIKPGGISEPPINQQATYTLTGPIPTDASGALTDTVILTDSTGTKVTATVTVIFADCELKLSADTVKFGGAKGGESFDITITNGVPPFTATHTFPAAGTLEVDNINGVVTYTIATPPLPVDPDTVLIRDSRGCLGTVKVTVESATVATLTLTANPTSVAAGESVTITAIAFDSNNQPFGGTTLLFSTTVGTVAPISKTTDSTGTATVTLTIPPGTPAGAATVTATAPGGATATVTVTITTTP